MGDNVYLGDRNGVRTPMQWSGDRNAGFSRADPQRLYLPPIMDPVYGYEAVNVEAQSRSTGSSCSTGRKRLDRAAQARPVFGRGEHAASCGPATARCWRTCASTSDEVAPVRRESVALAPAGGARPARSSRGAIPVELFGQHALPADRRGDLPADAAAARLLLVLARAQARTPEVARRAPATVELPVLVIPDGLMARSARAASQALGLTALLARRVREQLESEVMPQVLPRQRWFDGQGEDDRARALVEQEDVADDRRQLAARDGRTSTSPAASAQTYVLPWHSPGSKATARASMRSCTARSRGAPAGACRRAVRRFLGRCVLPRAGRRDERDAGASRWTVGECAIVPPRGSPGSTRRRLAASDSTLEQSNTLVVFGERLILKGFRRLRRGVNPEIEIGRFLTEVSPLRERAALCGSPRARRRGRRNEQRSPCCTRGSRTKAAAGTTPSRICAGSSRTRSAQGIARATADATLRCAAAIPPFARWDTLGAPHRARCTCALESRIGRPCLRARAAIRRRRLRCCARGISTTPSSRSSSSRACVHRCPTPRDGGAAAARSARPCAWHARAIVSDAIDAARNAMPRRLPSRPGPHHASTTSSSSTSKASPALPLERPPHEAVAAARRRGHAALVRLRGGRRAERRRPHARADRERASGRLLEWQRGTSRAFLAGYRAAIGDAPSFPRDEETFSRLVDRVHPRQSLHEIRYELDNRAEWVAIPLRAILDLLEGA